MREPKECWTDSDDPDKVLWGMSWRAIVIGVVALILCIAGSWAVFGLKVFTSPVKGAGEVVIANNDAKNRIQSQARFEALYHGIIAADKNLDILAATVKAHPNDRIAQQTLDGARIGCNQFVEDYNAEARKTTSADWRSWDLPSEINDIDPATDCKEGN